MIVVGRHVFARGIAQVFEDFLALQNLANGEGGQPVEVDNALLTALRTGVALGPLADVAVETHRGDVAAGHEIHRVALGDKVGEGQLACVGVVHQLAEADAERAYCRRQQQVGTAGRLGAALQHTPVHGTHLVSMIGEVGGRTCIVEAELRADEQRALVVAGGEWTAEGGASLAVAHIAIGEKHALRSGEAIADLAGLAHEAVLHLHRIDDAGALADDRVLDDDTGAHIDVAVVGAQQRAVAQPAGTVDLAFVLDDGIGDLFRVDDLHAVADDATVGHIFFHLARDDVAQLGLHLLVAGVLHHEGSELRVEVVEEHHVAFAHLVEHADEVAFAVGGAFGGLEGADIGDIAVVADFIVVDIVADVLNQTVVANCYVAQCRIVDTTMLEETICYFHVLLGGAQADVAVEHDTVEEVGLEVLVDENGCPILSPAAVIF